MCMFLYVLFNIPLLFFILLSFMVKLPHGSLVMQETCLQQKCLWPDASGKDVYGETMQNRAEGVRAKVGKAPPGN